MQDYKVCPTCGRGFEKNYHYSREYWRKQKYCSIKCSNTMFGAGDVPWNKGEKMPHGKDSPSFKGGRNKTVNGYIRVLVPGTGSYQLEHRAIMEEFLGRKLKSTEQVHHKNGDKTDNRLENLEIMNIREHSRLETTRRWVQRPESFNRGF